MNDKIKINLQMAGASYPLTINRALSNNTNKFRLDSGS